MGPETTTTSAKAEKTALRARCAMLRVPTGEANSAVML
jgi:hypothetical protein